MTTISPFAADLLAWYDTHARDLPWRVPPRDVRAGVRADPYRVWLSEVMLQQTTVKAVRAYFAKFTALWPDIAALAAAPEDEVFAAWAGLGYYSRARNLKRCAEMVAGAHGGRFPETKAGLLALPGIGDYTAAAIAAIAFYAPEAVIDGNVERVSARVLALETPLPAGRPAIRRFVESALPAGRPGDFAQAMMDLGATVCTPRAPACLHCPVRGHCAAQDGEPSRFPRKAPKAAKPMRRGAAYVALSADGAAWLRKRPAGGLLGGMAEVPGSAWTARTDGETGPEGAPFPASWEIAGSVTHVFTHFSLTLDVWRAKGATPSGAGWWSRDLDSEALPSLMRKVLARATADIAKGSGEQA